MKSCRFNDNPVEVYSLEAVNACRMQVVPINWQYDHSTTAVKIAGVDNPNKHPECHVHNSGKTCTVLEHTQC